jgi:ribose transport system ATP-binding protein
MTGSEATAALDTGEILEVRGAVKRFGATTALAGCDFALRAGEIHALLGENGAGKSTLIKALAGVYSLDDGRVSYLGGVVPPGQPLPAAFIHQDLGLVESMTVSENIALVAGYARPRALISWDKTRADAVRILESIGSDIDADSTVAELPLAERAIVAIARALARRARIVVLDEPTASLPASDVQRLFSVLRQLRDQGVGMIYVTHRLPEVFEIADRVTVFRDGRVVHFGDISEVTPSQLMSSITGEEPADLLPVNRTRRTNSLLELEALQVGGVQPVSLQVAAGEIVGLVGLRGAGQNEVGRALFGLETIGSGTLRIRESAVSISCPADAMRHGVAFVSGRREESLAVGMSLVENLFLNPSATATSRLRLVRPSDERRKAVELLTRFGVRPPEPGRLIETLSGGNQQKVVLARWLHLRPSLLVLEDPTAGVDVGAKADIYGLLEEFADEGAGIVVVSSDFEEIARICGRALVFVGGRCVQEVSAGDLGASVLSMQADIVR